MTSLPDIYLSFFMFTTDMKPTDPVYRKLVLAHLTALTARGYRGFEFPIAPTFGHDFAQDVADYRDLRQFLDDNGFADIKIATNVGATRTYDPSSPFAEQRELALAYLKSRVDITAALGGTIMMGPIVIPYGNFVTDDFGGPVWSDKLQDELHPRYVTAAPILQQLGEYATTKGVKLAIEPITHWETPGPNKLAQLLDFLQLVDSPTVGAVIDSAHETLDGEGPDAFAGYVAELARQERLHYVQVSPPDRGNLAESWMPWDGFLRPIMEVYKGPIAVEIFNAITVFDQGLRLSRRKFWVPGEDAPNLYPSAYETAAAAISATKANLQRILNQPTGKTLTKGTFYQYNALAGVDNFVYDGNLTVAQLKTFGDTALGSYDQLDGELIMIDGIAYRADDQGIVTVAEDDRKIVFANATKFTARQWVGLDSVTSYKDFQAKVGSQLPSVNLFYAFRLRGHFDYVKVGTLIKQEKPYTTPADELIENRPTFERENFYGTMVGFYAPVYTGDFVIHGFHLHLVSDDATFAGHVMDFCGGPLRVGIDHLYRYTADLPNSDEFRQADLKDSYQYNRKS